MGGFVSAGLALPAFAGAAQAPISGTLDQPGYTVIALAANGQATSVVAPAGAFRLVPTDAISTLHLRAPDGSYAGPIVVRELFDSVKLARTAVTKAKRGVAKATRQVRAAKRALRKARSRAARRAAAKRLRVAKATLRSANRKLRKARTGLVSARDEAAARPTWAALGVRAGAQLGSIALNRTTGEATAGLGLKAWRMWVDTGRRGRALGGVPLGAGNFGRVYSPPPAIAPAGDTDADGVANPLDVDDDGDLVLDDVERPARTSAHSAQTQEANPLGAFTILYELGNAHFPPAGPATQPVNANAPGITDDDIDAALRKEGRLSIAESGHQYESGELDCSGLIYCSAGGTGMREAPGGNTTETSIVPMPFPSCCDDDHDGQGSFDIMNGGLNLFLDPHASSDEIRTGDVLIAHGICTGRCASDGSAQRGSTATLGSVFATVPAIASYTDELGVVHPVTHPLTPWSGDAASGTRRGSEISVSDGPDEGSDVSVTLTFWRPQRRPIPKEVAAGSTAWIDMGGLTYYAHTPGAGSVTWCSADSYSDVFETDGESGLAPAEQMIPGSPEFGVNSGAVFIDRDMDQSAAIGHTFGYTLNLSRCFAQRGSNFQPGASAPMIFDAQLPLIPGHSINFAEAGYSFFHEPE